MKELPPIIDLFSGSGGMSLGLQQAGFTVLEGFDSWQCAVDTYSANLGHSATLLDLGDVETAISVLRKYSDGEFPVIVGGPPCQDFSSAGSRVEGERADLTEKFASIVTEFAPPMFVMENVARAARAKVFNRAVSMLESAGYAVEKRVLDASLYGVPQQRKRLITVGSLNPAVAAGVVEHLDRQEGDTATTVRDWFGDSLRVEAYYRHPRSYARRAIFSIDEPSPTIRGVNRPIPPGYKPHPGDATDPEHARALTTQERAAIQTFPEDFQWVGSRTNVEQMVGNAVPPLLAKRIGEAVIAVLARESLSHTDQERPPIAA